MRLPTDDQSGDSASAGPGDAQRAGLADNWNPSVQRRRLRLAVVSQYFWPEDFRVNDLVAELVIRGHDVQVLTGHPNYPGGRFLDGYGGLRPVREAVFGSTVARVPLMPRKQATGRQLLVNYASFAASAGAFGSTLIKGPIDAVLVYQLSPISVAVPALVLARIKRAPALMWVQDLWPDTLAAMGVLGGARLRRVALAATARLHRAMDSLLVQSRAFAAPLARQGVRPDRVHYVPNWAEDSYRPVDVPADAPERRGFPSGFTILFAGNLGVAQGLDVILGAAEELRGVPDLHWVVLGSGRRADWFAHQVSERGLEQSVHVPGRRPVETMPTWFALADVLVATLGPDPVYELTLPSKLQTYMACGKPILAAIGGEGARVLQESGAGIATTPGDARSLANAALTLYRSSSQDRAEIGLRGLEYYRSHFERTMIIDRVEALLYSAVETRRRHEAT